MRTEEEIISTQADLMRQAAVLVGERARQIEPLPEEKAGISDSESAIRLFRIRSLKLYQGVLEFLADEIIKEEPKRYFFLLPHVRTLLDIYSRFLHLLLKCPTDNEKALVCIAYQLNTYRNIGEEGYKKGLEFYKDFLTVTKPDFPQTPEALTWRWIRSNGLAFGSKSDLLTAENIKRFSMHALDVFGANKTYEIYSHISELLHGNPYLYNDSSHNERFWIAAMSLINTAFLLDMIDRFILDKGQQRDAREWLTTVKNSRAEFTGLWVSKRKAAGIVP